MSSFLEGLLRGLSPETVTSFIIFIMIAVFIGSSALSKLNKAGDFVHYTPTLLTTLGIFGTFVGIVIGLLDFDHTKIDASITMLLDGLKTAFITSLAGMLSSLLFKSLLTTPLLKPKLQADEVISASPEQILAAMQAQVKETQALKESIVGNDESTLFGLLKLMRSDMNDNAKLNKQLTEELSAKQFDNFALFSDKLWIKLQDFADTLSKSATEQVIEALKQVITDFNNNLTEQFGENFKQLNAAVIKLVDWQENYKLQLEHMNSQYEHGVQAITLTENSVAHISEQTKVIPQTMNELQVVMEVNQHQLSELESHLEAFKDMRDRAVEAVPEIRQQVENTVTEITKAVSVASEHYEDVLAKSDSFIKETLSSADNLIEDFVKKSEQSVNVVADKLIESSETIGKNIDLASNEFTDNSARTNASLQTTSDYLQSQTEVIKQTLDVAVTDLSNNMSDMIAKLVDDAKAMNTTLKDANQNLTTDTKEVRDIFVKSSEQLQDQMKTMMEEAAKQQVSQAQRTFDAMEDQIKQQVGLTGEAVEKQVGVIDQAMQQEINRVMNEMGTSLAQIAGQFTRDYKNLTLAMQSIVKEQVSA
ncbi:MAG: hypothetical protein GY928_16945 [Colwellia sp.]|nr:hypothetical protein [Colwellia sp.]